LGGSILSIQHIGQVGDRLDGKPKERQEHEGVVDHAMRIVWAGMPPIAPQPSAPQIENEPVAALPSPSPQPEVATAKDDGG
jgi:hypothetical protein